MTQLNLFLPCPAGVEDLLTAEVRRVSKARPEVARAGVYARGTWADVLALNLHSRLAQRVLVEVMHAEYHHEDDIYQAACDTQWEHWLTPRHTFKIDATAVLSPLQSLNFAALRVKDGLCDRFRHFEGARPSVDTERPDVRVFAHFGPTHLSLHVDTSGEPLFKRGWRFDKGDAPLKETLAAAMLEASGWAHLARLDGIDSLPLVDPCCGSGTIAIEAAQMVAGIAPGSQRRFGFERLLPFQRGEWDAMKSEAQNQAISATDVKNAIKNGFEPTVFGSDIAFRMVDFANTNAERAGVAGLVNFRGGDALQRSAPTNKPGVIVMNPPYGERIETRGVAGRGFSRDSNGQFEPEPSQREASTDFFAQLGRHWKTAYPGWSAWVLSPDMKLPAAMRYKEARRVPMWNGPIECRLFKFELRAMERKEAAEPSQRQV
jgi:putative N6-adenine-specific DNA methylase